MSSVAEDLFEPGSTINPPQRPIAEDVRKGQQSASDVIAALERIQTVPEDRATYHRDRPPVLRLPGFGQPIDDCGVPNPATSFVCAEHGHAHAFGRNCMRYDCPDHWRHAVRRRAAGSADGAGVAAQLESMRKFLDYHRDEHQRFHHLVFSPPEDLAVHASNPLARLVETCRDVMDALGVQGLVAYHAWKGKDEDHESNDMGTWKDLLSSDSPWDVINDDLEYDPHFHVVGVAHEALDYSIVEEIEAETGWVLHRIENEADNSVSIGNSFEMCKVVCYALSHAGVYSTDQQRRLAAWMKGPDVPHVQVYADTAIEVEQLVGEAAVDTLGIKPTDLTCDADVPPDEVHYGRDEGLPDFLRASEQREPAAAGVAAPLSAAAGPTVDGSWTGPDAYLPGRAAQNVEGVAAMASAPSELDDPSQADDFDPGSSAAGDNARADEVLHGDVVGDQDRPVDRTDVCGARLVHISQASEYLLSRPEWRERVQDDERLAHLDQLYRQYVSWLEHKDLDPVDVRPMVAEERHGADDYSDRPPPSEPDPPPD